MKKKTFTHESWLIFADFGHFAFQIYVQYHVTPLHLHFASFHFMISSRHFASLNLMGALWNILRFNNIEFLIFPLWYYNFGFYHAKFFHTDIFMHTILQKKNWDSIFVHFDKAHWHMFICWNLVFVRAWYFCSRLI